VNKYFECKCEHPAHTIRFTTEYGKNSQSCEVIVTTHLSKEPVFWKRLVTAFKYLFCLKTSFYCFDETILSPEQVESLDILFNEFLDRVSAIENQKDRDMDPGPQAQPH